MQRSACASLEHTPPRHLAGCHPRPLPLWRVVVAVLLLLYDTYCSGQLGCAQ
jgi:hypothetical protein